MSAVILSFSVVVTGKISSPATFYATAGGIAAAFISVFWSFGYIRLSEKLKRTANDPSKVMSLQITVILVFFYIGFKLRYDNPDAEASGLMLFAFNAGLIAFFKLVIKKN